MTRPPAMTMATTIARPPPASGDGRRGHRTWLLLVAALLWLFLVRYRLLGLALGRLGTLGLRLTQRRARALGLRLEIHHVRLSPIELVGVELTACGGAWRCRIGRLRLETRVGEFLRSFVQRKLVVVSVEDVHVDLAGVEEEALRAVLGLEGLVAAARQTTTTTTTTPAATPTTSHTTPEAERAPATDPPSRRPSRGGRDEGGSSGTMMGLMRFVDLRVRRIRIDLVGFETRSHVACGDFNVDIPEVVVVDNYLQLKVEAGDVEVSSRRWPMAMAMMADDDPRRHRHASTVGDKEEQDVLRMDMPRFSAVLDIRLTDQQCIGCNVVGGKLIPGVSVRIPTGYLEFLALKKRELIRRDLFPLPIRSRSEEMAATTRPSRTHPFAFRVVDVPVSMIIVHRSRAGNEVPLEIAMSIQELQSDRGTTLSLTHGMDGARIKPSVMPSTSIKIRLGDLTIRVGPEFAEEAVVLSSMQATISQSPDGQGKMDSHIGELRAQLNPVLCDVLHSLVHFPDVMDEHDRTAQQMIAESVARKLSLPAPSVHRKLPVTWSATVEVDSWQLGVSMHESLKAHQDLTANGSYTRVESTIPPKFTGQILRHHIEIQHVQVDIFLLQRPRSEKHSAIFMGLDVVSTKHISKVLSTVNDIAVTCAMVSINGFVKGQTTRNPRIPAAFVSLFSIHQIETSTHDSLNVQLDIRINDLEVMWSHQQHNTLLAEWTLIADILERSRIMLTPPEPSEVPVPSTGNNLSKMLDADASAASVRLHLLDVQDVDHDVGFELTECRTVHHKSSTGQSNNVKSAFVCLTWSNGTRGVEIKAAQFQNEVEFLSSSSPSPSRCDISLSEFKLRLRNDQRLLLLLLRIDELVNNKSDQEDRMINSKRPITQAIYFSTGKLETEILLPASSFGKDDDYLIVDTGSFSANAMITKSRSVSNAMLRYLQVTRREETGRGLLVDTIQPSMTLTGALTVQSLKATNCNRDIVAFEELKLNFSVTDVLRTSPLLSQTAPTTLPPRFLIFDASCVIDHLSVRIEKSAVSCLRTAISVLQDAVNIKEESADVQASSEADNPEHWRIRFVGTLDCGVDRLIITFPYNDDILVLEDAASVGSLFEERAVHTILHRVAVSCRQFQKVQVQFDSLEVSLTGQVDDILDCSSRESSDMPPPFQIIFIPHAKLDAVVHWRPELVASPDSATRYVQYFAVSFELILRGKVVSTNTQVPAPGEAMIALNWDYVYPLLVVLMTSNDDEEPDEATPRLHQIEASLLAFQCIGVQWNMSIDVLQVAWWDTMTQDTSLLVVANDFLSHGVARAIPGGSNDSGVLEWVLWETTAYLDLFRAYILRDGEQYGDNTTRCQTLPFNTTQLSQFFVETTGTSYRETFAKNSGQASDELPEALFDETGFATVDKMHDEFSPLDYSYSFGASSRLCRMDSVAMTSLPALDIAISGNPGSSTTSQPPKSPKSWTQSVRIKLARLKRRTSSMDNLLLNDGSRPIQVDSMKLLWTIETRDCSFYTIGVLGDTFDILMEARRQEYIRRMGEHESLINDNETKLSTGRPPTTTTSQPTLAKPDGVFRTNRRASTRETLLELLQQGKLGMQFASSKPENTEGGNKPVQSEKSFRGITEGEDVGQPKAIKHKMYTVDVHDAQINMLDSNTRSCALVASKHIHFEIGYDEMRATTVAVLRFDCVTAHVAPIDVDISGGVIWYAHSKASAATTQLPSPRGMSTASSLLLKQVLEECSLVTTYSQSLSSGATNVAADLSFLQMSTDRHQFYQLLNVLRHVILAPPMIYRRIVRPTRTHHGQTSVASEHGRIDNANSPVFPPTPTHSLLGGSTRKLHAQLLEELRIRDSKMLGTSRKEQIILKLISFRVSGCTCRLRTSPETSGTDHEFVEIRVEGIAGSHSYYMNQNTKLALNLQWMEINNLRPGPSSIAFEDPTSVLKAKLLIDQRFQSTSNINFSHQKGMLSIRAESGPVTRVLGQKLRILDVLEVSVFPEIPNMIVIQLASDFYELMYKFFFDHISSHDIQSETYSEQVLFGKKGSSSSVGPPTPVAGSISHPSSPGPRHRANNPFAPGSPSHSTGFAARRRSIQPSNASTVTVITESGNSITSGGSMVSISTTNVDGQGDDDDASSEGRELFYFKYVRIGNLRLRINCNGFFVNLNNFDLDLPPYVCQSKLCTWKKLLQKFESHLKWYVTKESASSGLSHFKNKLLKWTPTSSDKKEKHKRDGDSATMNAQVLFGPYSGASTSNAGQ